MNQSRPRALACGDALAVAGAVCFNAVSDGRPTSTRRSSRPPSNSSANVDSPLSPAPRGTTASVFGRMPLAFDPPTCSDTPQPPHWPEGVSECARRYSNMRKEAILRSAVSSARICNQEKVPKFQTSAIRNSCAQMPSPETTPPLFLPPQRRHQTLTRAAEPANVGPFGSSQEISASTRVPGGLGRTRTSNETVMGEAPIPDGSDELDT